MDSIRRKLGALLLACMFSSSVHATSFSTDQSDLWYIPSESGWGMQLVQRDSTIFATLFVYGQSGTPTWYVSTMQSTGSLVWSGPLYATTGPWFGTVPFDPTTVGVSQVGSMTWSSPLVDSGTVTYSVNGVVVSKSVVRQVLVADNYNGTYPGVIHGAVTGCFNPADNVTSENVVAAAVIQSGTSVSIGLANGAGVTCTFAGTLTPQGQFGKVSGSYSCGGDFGTFEFFELNVGFNYMTSRFATSSTNLGCQTAGYIAGIRHR